MNPQLYDLVIIGGGPAGAAAGVYAARKQIRTLIVTTSWGGQSTDSIGIQNWIGVVEIPGAEFGNLLRKHVTHYASDYVDIRDNESVRDIIRNADYDFKITTDKGEYRTKTILVATGSHRRKLEVPGAKEYENKGIVYCASCDGPLFADKNNVVIGGGNAAFESAAQLLAYSKSVTLLNRSEEFRADPVTVEAVSKNPKIKIIKNAIVKEIKGNTFVSSLIYTDLKANEDKEIECEGVFVEIGLLPTTGFAERVVELNEHKQIKIDPRNGRTTTKGIWAAGDCTDTLFHQNNIAAGDAIKATEDIYLELHKI